MPRPAPDRATHEHHGPRGWMLAGRGARLTVGEVGSHSSSALRRGALYRRRRRGASLLVTVLVSVIAASITLVIVRQGLTVTRNESSQRDADAAVRLTATTKDALEADLADDPRFFLSRTFSAERARRCTARTPVVVVQPGNPWDPRCGSTWAYVAATAPGAAVVELTAPTPGEPRLGVRVQATVGDTTAGVVLKYRLAQSGRYMLWSEADLDLDQLAAATAASTISGSVYTRGRLGLPSGTTVAVTNAQLAAEAGFVGTPDDPALRYYAAAPNPAATPPLRDIRSVVPQALSSSALRASVERAAAVGCAGADPAVLGSGLGNQLCLRTGEVVRNVAGVDVVVPAAAAWLLILGADGNDDHVEVRYAATAPAYTGACALACNLTALASPEVAAGTHPGAMNHWTALLGTFPLPVNGVVVTGADTHLGLCGTNPAASPATGFLAPPGTGTCETRTPGSTDAMGVGRSLTVVVGTAAAPADAYLSGPVRRTGAGRLSVVASGDAIVPYWARPAGTDLALELSALALGLGQGDGVRSAVHALPAQLTPSTGPADPNYGRRLTITGTVAAPALELALAGFTELALVPDQGLFARPTPWLPGFSDRWEEVAGHRMAPAEFIS